MNRLATRFLIAFLLLEMTSRLNGQTAPLYETFEWSRNHTGVSGNRFTTFGSLTFTKGSRSFTVDSFYDGDDTWRARFMPDEVGTWNYSWSLEGESGNGFFTVTAPTNPDNHGHVHRDAAHPRYLVYDDGTPHYWYGGKWISGPDYGPASKGGNANPAYISDAQFTDYLDTMQQKGHNGLLLKTALFPLEDDKLSWDLDWIHRGERLVEQMRDRGIYAQVNLFDTWSRGPNGEPGQSEWFSFPTNGNDHAFNVWSAGDEAAKENYIRTLVARFAGYSNVYWELGNEMEHAPNSGALFVGQANSHYIPWIRQHDPYDLPIGVSESSIWSGANVDIAFLHQTNSLPPVGGDRVFTMNELVFGWSGGPLWQDEVIRNANNRFGYRRTFWRMFTYGGSGSSEATWLDIRTPLNPAVLEVMDDQQRLRSFVEALPTDINEMDTDTTFVLSGPGQFRTRSKFGESYATYFMLNPGQSVGPGSVTLALLPGEYQASWHDPKTGVTVSQSNITSNGSTVLPYQGFTEDIALSIARMGDLPEPTTVLGWEFNTDGNREGWSPNSTARNRGVLAGTWNLAPSGIDPILFGPTIAQDAALAPIIEITMSSTDSDTDAQLFWKVGGESFSEQRSQRFSLVNDGRQHAYRLVLAGDPDWTGTITQLRVDPVRNGNGGALAIDSIRLLSYAVPEPGSAMLVGAALACMAFGGRVARPQPRPKPHTF